MQQFAPCLIKLDEDDTAAFIAAAHRTLAHPWYHHRSKPDIEGCIHFRRDAIAGSSPIILSLFREDSETLKVSNIVPKEGCLSIDEWRAILIDFESSVLHKIRARGLEFVTFIGSDNVNLAEMMNPFAWKLLRSVAALTLKDQDALHPCDHIRFLEFISILHLTSHRFTPHDLSAWLREQGFSLNFTSQLQYELGYHLELLKIYDRLRKSREATLAQQSRSQP